MPFPTVHHLNCHKNWAGKKCASYCYCQFSKLKVLYHHFRVFLIYFKIEFLKILFWAVTMTCGRYADESKQFTNNFKILKHFARIFFFFISFTGIYSGILNYMYSMPLIVTNTDHQKKFKYTVPISKNTIWHYICCWFFWGFFWFLKRNIINMWMMLRVFLNDYRGFWKLLLKNIVRWICVDG